eukprot:1759175-Amphidinium_carterae.2
MMHTIQWSPEIQMTPQHFGQGHLISDLPYRPATLAKLVTRRDRPPSSKGTPSEDEATFLERYQVCKHSSTGSAKRRWASDHQRGTCSAHWPLRGRPKWSQSIANTTKFTNSRKPLSLKKRLRLRPLPGTSCIAEGMQTSRNGSGDGMAHWAALEA